MRPAITMLVLSVLVNQQERPIHVREDSLSLRVYPERTVRVCPDNDFPADAAGVTAWMGMHWSRLSYAELLQWRSFGPC